MLCISVDFVELLFWKLFAIVALPVDTPLPVKKNSLFQEMLEILHEELKEMRGRRAASCQLVLVNVRLSLF